MDFSSTRVEISLDALKSNLEAVKNACGAKEIIAVVKANAYGHGISIITSHLKSLGVSRFAVSSVSEAEQIRDIARGCDILILGQTPETQSHRVAAGNFVQAIGSLEYARRFTERTRIFGGGVIRGHVKLDSGMTRTGIDSIDELREILEIPGLNTEALFTHFSCADSDDIYDRDYTVNQQAKLVEFANLYNLKFHSQNSGGVFNHADFEGDMVRVGLALYGYFPGNNTDCNAKMTNSDEQNLHNAPNSSSHGLKQVMKFKSTVTQVREIAAGVAVGYGRTYVADSPRKLAVIPVGYADGYSRALSGRGKVLIRGIAAPIRGRVSMEYIVADVTEIFGVEIGEEVELFSSAHPDTSVEHIARTLGTIPYEITTAVAARVPRVAV
ncbi:MAG: alanine racemase [Oscillospiraceae bacterium]|nr:alanine racemase [Oscillospiraceae bacterium]